jgi:hypothetical protein
MGSNRKKKAVQNTNGKIQLTPTTTCSKPDEAAASSMSSESSAELILTASEFMKSSTLYVSKNNNSSKTANNSHTRNGEASLWAKTVDDIERSSNNGSRTTFRFSWNEILALCFMLLTFAICSIVVGVAAGVSISIHYYESPENLDQRRIAVAKIATDNTQFWDSRVSTQTVTSLDPAILIYSKNYYPSNGERVVHTDTSTGMRIPLNVVVESPTLSTDARYTPQSNGTHRDDQNNDENFYQNEHTLSPPTFTSNENNFDIWLYNPPKLCADSKTMGYDSWSSLRHALNDVNRYSAQRSERWLMYFTSLATIKASSSSIIDTALGHPSTIIQGGIPIFDDDNLYYEEQFTFTICPGTVLHAGAHPLVVDTESVTIQCDGCTINGGDSHISFGSAAKNTIIRGITFQNSKRSSILLHHNGAEVTFEDCVWFVANIDSDMRQRHIMPGLSEITNVNSSSILNFYRCSTIQPKLPRFWWHTTGNS